MNRVGIVAGLGLAALALSACGTGTGAALVEPSSESAASSVAPSPSPSSGAQDSATGPDKGICANGIGFTVLNETGKPLTVKVSDEFFTIPAQSPENYHYFDDSTNASTDMGGTATGFSIERTSEGTVYVNFSNPCLGYPSAEWGVERGYSADHNFSEGETDDQFVLAEYRFQIERGTDSYNTGDKRFYVTVWQR